MKKNGTDTMCGNKLSPMTHNSFVTHFISLLSIHTMNNKYHAKFKGYVSSGSIWGIVYNQGVIDTGSQK